MENSCCNLITKKKKTIVLRTTNKSAVPDPSSTERINMTLVKPLECFSTNRLRTHRISYMYVGICTSSNEADCVNGNVFVARSLSGNLITELSDSSLPPLPALHTLYVFTLLLTIIRTLQHTDTPVASSSRSRS